MTGRRTNRNTGPEPGEHSMWGHNERSSCVSRGCEGLKAAGGRCREARFTGTCTHDSCYSEG